MNNVRRYGRGALVVIAVLVVWEFLGQFELIARGALPGTFSNT